QFRVGDVRQPGRVRVLPGAQRVVEHHPRAPEGARQRGPLPRRGVEAVIVPELHDYSILGLWLTTVTSALADIVSSSCTSTWFSSPSTGIRCSLRGTWNAWSRSCGTCAQTSAPSWPSS